MRSRFIVERPQKRTQATHIDAAEPEPLTSTGQCQRAESPLPVLYVAIIACRKSQLHVRVLSHRPHSIVDASSWRTHVVRSVRNPRDHAVELLRHDYLTAKPRGVGEVKGQVEHILLLLLGRIQGIEDLLRQDEMAR
jgi:hypothetical protein